MVRVQDGRSGNASEYVYLFLKGWPLRGWSQYLASLSTTILYMQYPLPRFEHLAALRQAWQLLKQNKSLYRYPLIISLLTLGMLGYVFFSGHASSASQASYLPLVVGTLNGILTYLFLMRVVKFFAGEAYPTHTRVARLKHFAGFVLLAILFGLGAGVGLVLFFVPGFYFLNRCFLAPMLYLDGKAGIFASFRESWTRTKGHFYTLLSALGIVLLLAAVNAVTLQLATVIILPVATLYLFILYRYLQEIPQDKTPAL